MRILLADKLHPEAVEGFERLPGATVTNRSSLSAEELPQALAGQDILVVRSTKVRADALAQADRLGLIIRAGAGVNTIDVKTASAAGIFVANCPGKNAVAVAEITLALLLALDRHVADGVAELRAGRWDKKRFAKSRGLKGLRAGIIGTGSIGQAVIRRLQSFEMEILAWSRSLTEAKAEELGVQRVARLHDLTECDVVSVHVALTADTRGLVGQEFLSALKPGSYFLNTSRAEVVDSQALLAALERGVKAGLDVFDGEPSQSPSSFENPIAQHPNCYGSHHVGASTDQSERDTGLEALRVATAFAEGEAVPNCVNLRSVPDDGYALVVRHQDRVGVLAAVLTILKEAGLNVQEMENKIFQGAEAACARLVLDCPVPTEVADRLSACDGVLHVSSKNPSPVGV